MIIIRLTLDWDDISFNEAVRKFKILSKHYPNHRMEAEVSANSKGFHIIIYKACKTYSEQLHLRKKFWDDPKRIIKDSQRWKKGIPGGILFTKKGGKYVRRY